jgi:hypothetical protein
MTGGRFEAMKSESHPGLSVGSVLFWREFTDVRGRPAARLESQSGYC